MAKELKDFTPCQLKVILMDLFLSLKTMIYCKVHVEKKNYLKKDWLKSMDCCCPNTLGKPLNILSSLNSPNILSSLGDQPLNNP